MKGYFDAENTKEITMEKCFGLITEKLVKTALREDKGEDAELLFYNLKKFTKKGDNFITVVAAVEVRFSNKGIDYHESYVAKMNPCLSNNPLNDTLDYMFSLETDVLLTIIGGMNEQLDIINLPLIRSPKLFARNLEVGKQAFIEENLRSQGFKMYDKRKEMDLNHAHLVLKELGRFHASSLLYEETLYPKTIEESFNFKVPRYNYNEEIFKLIVKICSSYSKIICDVLKEKGPKYNKCIDWLNDNSYNLSKYFVKGFLPENQFNVLVHGDCWTNNFLFRYDDKGKPVEIRLLDFQHSMKASPTADLIYFFYTCLNVKYRVEKINHLISTYYESFANVLTRAEKSPPFSFEELLLEIKNRRIFGLSSFIITLCLTLSEDFDSFPNSNEKDEPDTFPESQIKAFKEMMKHECPLKDRLFLIFDEFINYGAFN